MRTFPTTFPVTCHTDYIGAGSTFVAIHGAKENGIAYIPLALKKGATTIVVPQDSLLSDELIALIEKHGALLYRVAHIRQALAQLSAQAHGFPTRSLKIIGITGTVGKTTTSFLVEHVLKYAGYKTALVGSVHNVIDGQKVPHNLTTPHADYLQVFFSECVKAGVEYVVMEVSAQALTLDRVYDIEFEGIIFTNFSKEHGEFYATQEDYLDAKYKIFEQLKPYAPIIANADDEVGTIIIEQFPQVYSCSLLQPMVDYHLTVQQQELYKGLLGTLATNACIECVESSALIGTFNAYNAVSAIALTKELGISQELIIKGLKVFTGVPGRMQRYELSNGAYCIIDYAYNSLTFNAVLSTLRPSTEQLIVLFGAGGSRDLEKRPLMGEVAARWADSIFLTTDNPRMEDPAQIIEQILGGISADKRSKVVCELDREQAIKKAFALSKAGTIIVLFGKGPDEYQEIQGIKYPFSERTIIQSL